MSNPYINSQNSKQYALDVAEKTGRKQFARVGQSFLDRIERRFLAIIRDEVQRHPSLGKTLK